MHNFLFHPIFGEVSVVKRVIFAFDVGSTRSRFGWARIEPDTDSDMVGSTDIDQLAAWIGRDLKRNYSVALGIEAPLFLPEPNNAADLSRSRNGEGNRSFAAPPGLAVAALGMHQTAWLLRKLYQSCDNQCVFSLDWQMWPPVTAPPIFFGWEAFVSAR